MPKVKIGNMEINYEVHGMGKPLLMLHAFSFSSKMWEPVVPAFTKHFKTYLVDLPGHGKSTSSTKKFTHKQAARDIYTMLEKLGVKQFNAIGYSSGAMTLLHMATQQPERIEKMVLISGTPYFPKGCREIMNQMTVDNITETEWKYYRNIGYSEEQTRMLRQQFHEMKNSYDDMNFTPPILSTIQTKTLIVHGDRDRFFPLNIPVSMYESIPNSYLFIVPNFGHSLDNELGVMVDSVSAGEKQLLGIKTDTALEFLKGSWDKS